MKKYFLIFLLYLLLASVTKAANCDIQPIAQDYLNDICGYVNFGFAKPSLEISSAPLVQITGEKKNEYGKVLHSKGFKASQLDFDQNKITIYSHIFDGHSCDDFVTQKLKKFVMHEYTHHLDQNGDLSKIVHAKNMEVTAITGENILPKMVWGKRNPMVLRELSKKEKKEAKKLQRFIFKHKNQR